MYQVAACQDRGKLSDLRVFGIYTGQKQFQLCWMAVPEGAVPAENSQIASVFYCNDHFLFEVGTMPDPCSDGCVCKAGLKFGVSTAKKREAQSDSSIKVAVTDMAVALTEVTTPTNAEGVVPDSGRIPFNDAVATNVAQLQAFMARVVEYGKWLKKVPFIKPTQDSLNYVFEDTPARSRKSSSTQSAKKDRSKIAGSFNFLSKAPASEKGKENESSSKRRKTRKKRQTKRMTELDILLSLQGEFKHVVDIVSYEIDAETDWYEFKMPRLQDIEETRDAMFGEQMQALAHATVFLLDMVGALEFLASRGVVHRDLSTGNIMWYPARQSWRLIDFDLAVVAPKGKNIVDFVIKNDGVVGTRPFIAPEILAGHDYNASVDRFSLGAVYNATVNEWVVRHDVTDTHVDNLFGSPLWVLANSLSLPEPQDRIPLQYAYDRLLTQMLDMEEWFRTKQRRSLGAECFAATIYLREAQIRKVKEPNANR